MVSFKHGFGFLAVIFLLILCSLPAKAWFDADYDMRLPVNCSLMDSGIFFAVNGTSGFNLGNGAQLVWAGCQNNLSVYYKSANVSDWIIANESSEVFWKTIRGNNSGNNASGVFADSNLVSHFGFDEVAGASLFNSSDGRYSATHSYSVVSGNTTSIFGTSIYTGANVSTFPQTSVNATDLSAVDIGGNFTHCGWYYHIGAFSTWTGMFFKASTDYVNGLGVLYNSGKYFNLYSGSATYRAKSPSIEFPINSWNYVCLVYNATAFSVYINGTFRGATNYASTNLSDTSPSLKEYGVIGVTSGSGYNFWNAYVDEVSFWKSTRSAVQINASYQNYKSTIGYGMMASAEAGCAANWTNTSIVLWQNVSCLSSDLLNQSWNYTTYDVNVCGGANSTTTFFSQNISCDFCTPNISVFNTSCAVNDTKTQWFNDTHNCFAQTGLSSDNTSANSSFTCNYCSYNITNATGSWTDYLCVWQDNLTRRKTTTEYDANYDSCYALTGLASDLWNSGSNNSYYAYQLNQYCDFCAVNSCGCQFHYPDCSGGFTCVANVCLLQGCTNHLPDCAVGQTCVANVCLLNGCANNLPACAFGQSCVGNACLLNGCGNHLPDCKLGWDCVNNSCEIHQISISDNANIIKKQPLILFAVFGFLLVFGIIIAKQYEVFKI
jgi:hypothetical protein